MYRNMSSHAHTFAPYFYKSPFLFRVVLHLDGANWSPNDTLLHTFIRPTACKIVSCHYFEMKSQTIMSCYCTVYQ